MSRLRNILCFLCVILSVQSITAQNHDSALIRYVIKKLNITLVEDEVVYKLEATIPYEKNMAIILIANPKAMSQADDCDYCFEYESHIIIINTKTKEITNYLFENYETNGWASDAVFIEDFKFDFAPYYLKPNQRAIGVRVYFRNNSSASPMSHETLSLFMKRENTLYKVLKNYEISHFFGEWDTVCGGRFKKETKTLHLTKHSNHKYFDIRSKSKLSITETTMKEDDCIEKVKHETKQEILKFDGNRYVFED